MDTFRLCAGGRRRGLAVAVLALAVVLAATFAPAALAQEAPSEEEGETIYYEPEEITCGTGSDEIPEPVEESEAEYLDLSGRMCAAPGLADYAAYAYGSSTTSSTETAGRGTWRCTWVQYSRYAKNLLRRKLWEYFLRVYYCYDGFELRDVRSKRWAEVHGLWWDFKGHIGWYADGTGGDLRAERWTQGKFQLCAPRVGCAQTKTPWVQLVVYGSGAWSYDGG